MSECNARCKTCRFSSGLSNSGFRSAKDRKTVMVCCDYIGFNKVSRGCPAGAECTKYEPRKRGRKNRIPRAAKDDNKNNGGI